MVPPYTWPILAFIKLDPSQNETGRNLEVVQGVFRSCKICYSRAPGGQGKHQITLVHKNKITFQKVLDNFAFNKKSHYLLTQMCVCLSVRLCISATNLKNLWLVRWMVAKFSGPANLLASNFWAGDLDPGAPGVRSWPQKGGFCQI